MEGLITKGLLYAHLSFWTEWRIL